MPAAAEARARLYGPREESSWLKLAEHDVYNLRNQQAQPPRKGSKPPWARVEATTFPEPISRVPSCSRQGASARALGEWRAKRPPSSPPSMEAFTRRIGSPMISVWPDSGVQLRDRRKLRNASYPESSMRFLARYNDWHAKRNAMRKNFHLRLSIARSNRYVKPAVGLST